MGEIVDFYVDNKGSLQAASFIRSTKLDPLTPFIEERRSLPGGPAYHCSQVRAGIWRP